MNDPELSKHNLSIVRDLGVGISIDDFGTGYSSLSYLHYFPITVLKIDRSFVQNMHEDESSMCLIQSIISLARNMNMKIIAEGIEEEMHLKALRQAGCHAGQGYFIAKPLSKSDFLDFLQTA